MKIFNDIKVVPYSKLLNKGDGSELHQGGPIWPDWESQMDIRFHRHGIVFDERPNSSISTEFESITETMYWCGEIVPHFGHQIADFISRIGLYEKENNDVLFAFSSHPDFKITSIKTLPPFFVRLMNWFQIPLERIKIITKPSIISKLIVVPQQEAMGSTPSQEYLSALTKITEQHFGKITHKADTIYVSRAGIKKGIIAGESYLEYFLGKQGVKVIRPEVLSMKEQLKIYASAKRIIFSEGSAVHTLQLLGKLNADIVILNRRENSRIAKNSLEARAKNLIYYDFGKSIDGIDVLGNNASNFGILLPDSEKFVQMLLELGLNIEHFSHSVFDTLVKYDVKLWLSFLAEDCQSSQCSEKVAALKDLPLTKM